MVRLRAALACVMLGAGAAPVAAQGGPEARTYRPLQVDLNRVTCPGDPPGNLASIDCYYTMGMRTEKLFGGSVTDQAILGSTFFGLVAHVRKSPPEWERGWEGLGRRVGTRYGQGVAKGLVVFGVGALIRSDPRPVTYASDPLIDKKQAVSDSATARQRRGRAWTRIGHAVMDWATVRKSDETGAGGRMPNYPLVAGAVTSALTGNLWYPDRLTTREETLKRIGGSLGTALFSSFYNEFQPELGRIAGRIFRRGASPPVARPATPGGPT